MNHYRHINPISRLDTEILLMETELEYTSIEADEIIRSMRRVHA